MHKSVLCYIIDEKQWFKDNMADIIRDIHPLYFRSFGGNKWQPPALLF